MISTQDAREIASEWREKFIDETAFETSWKRYFEMVGDPSEDRLIAWLRQDQMKDAVVHAGIIKPPLLPLRQNFELSECECCKGLRYVRRDLPVGHPEFGKAIPCPGCNR